MARTIHRQPNIVDTDVDVDIQFHSHSNWKGLCDDKNYLNVDQETFEDCKNVYMSSDALLKSRPSFKCKNESIKYIKKWIFGDVIFALTETKALIQLSPKLIAYAIKNPMLFQKEGIIFVFYENGIRYYDESTQSLKDAKDLMHVPITDIYTDNVKSDDGESENLLINSKKIVYNYTDFRNIDITNIPSNNVEIKIGDANYKTNIKSMTSKILVDSYLNTFPLSNDVISNKPLISISKRGNAICCQRLENDVLGYVIYTTVDFITWTVVDTVTDATSPPKISHDGSLAYYVSDNKVKVKSLLEVNNVYEYPQWMILFTLPDFDDLGELNSDERDITYERNIACNVKISTPNTYAAVYGVGLDVDVNRTENQYYPYKYLKVYIVKDGVVVVNETVTKYEINGSPYTQYDTYDLVGDYLDFDYCFYYRNDELLTYVTILAKTYRNEKSIWNSPIADSVELISIGFGHTDEETLGLLDEINCSTNFSLDWSSITHLSVSDERLTETWVPNLTFFTKKVVAYDNVTYETTYATDLHRFYLSNKYDDVVTVATSNILHNSGAISRETSSIITFDKYYTSVQNVVNGVELLHVNSTPIAFIGDTFYYEYDDKIYINVLKKDTVATFSFITGDEKLRPITFEYNCELNEEYLSKGNNLYISENTYDSDGNFKLYFPKIKHEQFNKPITNLHPVSQNQIAIFFNDEIWYTEKIEKGHVYYKSKLQVGLKEGSDVLTSQDGQNIIFSSTRGLVYMSYQELVQSTEQTLTYLSDTIYDRYKDFNKKPVKLFLNDFWLYCYHTDEQIFYIFDVRNQSWWKWEYYYPILNILIINNEPEFLTDAPEDNCMYLDYSGINYYDDVIFNNYMDESKIDWFVRSQKLHLGTLNYTKNVSSIIINNVEIDDVNEDVSFNLSIKNYRTKVSDRYAVPQNLLYEVNALRTYVKRCNSRKVNEFQYTLEYDSDNAIQLPLSVHSIIVKYTISGRVR